MRHHKLYLVLSLLNVGAVVLGLMLGINPVVIVLNAFAAGWMFDDVLAPWWPK